MEKETNKKLVYAVDDEEAIRDVYRYALEGAGFGIRCFVGENDLLVATEKRVPDIFILDIMLDGADGYEILKNLKQNPHTRNVPVIMVSAKTSEIDKVKGLDLGADDYLAKPFGVLELVARINAKLRSSKKSGGAISYKDVVIDCDKREVTVGGRLVALTLKQYELLKLLAENAGKVLERDFLLDNVWGENYGETRTLDIHVGELRKVLSSSDSEIATVRGVGYVLK